MDIEKLHLEECQERRLLLPPPPRHCQTFVSFSPPPILHTFFLLFNTCGPFYHPGHLAATISSYERYTFTFIYAT